MMASWPAIDPVVRILLIQVLDKQNHTSSHVHDAYLKVIAAAIIRYVHVFSLTLRIIGTFLII
jgi:hypothetical protein